MIKLPLEKYIITYSHLFVDCLVTRDSLVCGRFENIFKTSVSHSGKSSSEPSIQSFLPLHFAFLLIQAP